MGFIYKIQNQVNGKCYIGCSSKETIQERYGKNLYSLSKEADKIRNNPDIMGRPIVRAVIKYGIENFTISIIEDNIEENALHEREMYNINLHDSWIHKNGYNVSDNKYTNTSKCKNLVELSKKMTKINAYYNFNTEETFVGSRHEMSSKYSLNISCLSCLSSGRIMCYKSWCLVKNKHQNFERDGYYYFHNKNTKNTHLLKKCQLIELYKESKLNSGAISSMCLRKISKSHKGWIVLDNGENILEKTKEKEIFVEIWDNINKKSILFTKKSDIKKFVKDNNLGRKFNDMIAGKRNKYNQYCLINRKDDVFKNYKWKNNDTGEEFFGTPKEMTSKFDSSVGASFYNIAKKVNGFVSCKGWCLNEK